MLFGREPAVIMGAIQAFIGALQVFGLTSWTGDQMAAVMALAAAISTVIIRQNVYSEKTVTEITDAGTTTTETSEGTTSGEGKP